MGMSKNTYLTACQALRLAHPAIYHEAMAEAAMRLPYAGPCQPERLYRWVWREVARYARLRLGGAE